MEASSSSTSSTSSSTQRFLEPAPATFWRSLGIFEEALRQKKDPADLRAEARRQLTLLGLGNLRLLCEGARLAWDPESHPPALVQTLVDAADDHTLIHLREFMRWKTDAIDEVFESVFTPRQRSGLEADLDSLSANGKAERLKPFAKLLLLYRSRRAKLLDAFYLQMWRSRPSSAEYTSDKELPRKIPSLLEDVTDEIEKAVSGALSRRPVRLLGVHRLSDDTTVIVLHREFNGTIKRDFRLGYNVHFGCGSVIFGVSADRKRVILKSGDKRVQEAVRHFFERKFKAKLASVRSEVFSEFDPKTVEKAFLGDYSLEQGVEITSVDFRRSSLQSRCPVAVRCSAGQNSLREELRTLSQAKVIGLHSLDDLSSVGILFRGKAATITMDVSPGGAVTLKFDDTGWEESLRKELEEHFRLAFGVPVNQYLDPFRLEHGGVRVAASLLAVRNVDDVQQYQEPMYEALIDDGLLVCEGQTASICSNPLCRPKRPLPEEAQVCPRCDNAVESGLLRTVRRNDAAIAKFASSVFSQATGWDLGKPKTFEGVEYYPLKLKNGPESDEVCVLIRDRLPVDTKVKFLRMGQAMIVIEPHTDDRFIYPDEEGIGRVSLAYLYAAQQAKEKQACGEKCKSLLRSLLEQYQERVYRAARLSLQKLRHGTGGDPGFMYETEIFNVLRAIMPYCYQIGRESEIEPDGFVCVPVYESDAMEGVESWNWTYDAKHSDLATGYKLGSGEWRKIVNYIDKFRTKLAFSDRSCKIRAHIIISNNLQEGQMKNAAKNVFSAENGVSKKNRDVRLVLMREGFVTRLYELVTQKRDDFQRRRPHFGKLLVDLLNQENVNKFTTLDAADAERLMRSLLLLRPVEKAMTEAEVLRGLEG